VARPAATITFFGKNSHTAFPAGLFRMTRSSSVVAVSARDDSPDDAELPSSGVRTIVTLLLLWHLFAVGLAWLTNLTLTPSLLLVQTKENTPLLAPYLRTLWMDVGYGFRWTSGQPSDVGCALVADVTLPDGSVKRVVLPGLETPGRRREQYEKLANEAGVVGINGGSDEAEESASRVLMLVGGELLRDNKSDKLEVSVRRPREERAEALVSVPLAQREVANDRDYDTAYRAAITRDKDNQLSLIKLEAASRSAPVTAPATDPGKAGTKPTGGPRINTDAPFAVPLDAPR
jgi:hypothetical protein